MPGLTKNENRGLAKKEVDFLVLAEAYVGEYASGKSEVAVNRALQLLSDASGVTLADLDLVEPCYTLRPLQDKLTKMGLKVISWQTGDVLGLGETGGIIHPAVRWVLHSSGPVVLDVGYGAFGAKTLDLLEKNEEKDLRVYGVVNCGRPLTSSVEGIVDYVLSLGRVDGLVNNSHLGEETDEQFILESYEMVKKAADCLQLPLKATSVLPQFAALAEENCDTSVWLLQRYMDKAFW